MLNLDPQQITVIALLFAIGGAGLKKLWVFGWTYAEKDKALAEMTTDRNFWRDTALASLTHVDRLVDGDAKKARG